MKTQKPKLQSSIINKAICQPSSLCTGIYRKRCSLPHLQNKPSRTTTTPAKIPESTLRFSNAPPTDGSGLLVPAAVDPPPSVLAAPSGIRGDLTFVMGTTGTVLLGKTQLQVTPTAQAVGPSLPVHCVVWPLHTQLVGQLVGVCVPPGSTQEQLSPSEHGSGPSVPVHFAGGY